MKNTKKTNQKTEELIKKIDSTITDLVYEKSSIIKAYNYYHGKRDADQFRHLEENYGIGTPTSVEFVPLVRKHIDVLVGEYISTPITPKISCKDSSTLENILKEKEKTITNDIVIELRKYLQSVLSGTPDKDFHKSLESKISFLNKEYLSDYEIAGQNIIDYLMQARNIDFHNKRKLLLIDLLVAGICYFRIAPTPSKTNISFRVLNPINTFIDRDYESPYLKDSSRAVIREFLTKQQILARYGEYINKEDLEELESLEEFSYDEAGTVYLRAIDSVSNNMSDGILGGFEVSQQNSNEGWSSKYYKTIPVYDVEFLETEKENNKFITKRYSGVRVGHSIYINVGEDTKAIRSLDDPSTCKLSINGIFSSDRNGDPFSLTLATASLQDKFDILNFFRDNIIAESGSIGDWIDMAHLPTFLGSTMAERLLKWKAYKKSGMALYDSSQEGQAINTSFNGFDDTIKLQTIQAIELAIQRVEETCSTITGVFRERLGGVEQKDAVTNVQVGVKQSSYITKQYYQLMDLMTREALLDSLDLFKIVFKKGITGSIVLGDKLNKIFTAFPQYYTHTDFDIHISDSSEVIKEQELIRQFAFELTKSGQIDAGTIVEVMTSNSLTKMKTSVQESLSKIKEENNQVNQLGGQVDQLNQQLQQATAEMNKMSKELEKLNQEKLKLEREKLTTQNELEWFKAKSEDSFREDKLKLDQKRIELEGLQLLDNNLKNDEIKNS